MILLKSGAVSEETRARYSMALYCVMCTRACKSLENWKKTKDAAHEGTISGVISGIGDSDRQRKVELTLNKYTQHCLLANDPSQRTDSNFPTDDIALAFHIQSDSSFV